MSETVEVTTGLGPARMYAVSPARPRAVLLLGHGAGGGVDAPDLEAMQALGEEYAVLRFEQPWRTAGKRVAPAPARLDEGWIAAVEHVEQRYPGIPLVVGGRSAGARVACRWAGGHPVAGVLTLSFPLRPPGKPEKSRAAELLGATCPVLMFQGDRDPFGGPAEVAAATAGEERYRLIPVPGCAHELKPAKRSGTSPEDVADLVVIETARFLERVALPRD